jgi:hypothetical protein
MEDVEKRIDALRHALIEIRNVAHASENTEFYFMIARNALDEDEKYIIRDTQSEVLPFPKDKGDDPNAA